MAAPFDPREVSTLLGASRVVAEETGVPGPLSAEALGTARRSKGFLEEKGEEEGLKEKVEESDVGG